MTRWPVSVTAVCLLMAFGAVYAANESKNPSGEKAPKCCKELLSRIERLEPRVQQLEARSPVITLPQPPSTQPPIYRFDQVPQIPSGRLRDLPPGTQEREFNGMKYYIIPLEKAREQR